MWLVWFLEAEDRLKKIVALIESQGIGFPVNAKSTISFLIFGCVLLGMLLVGTVALFVSSQRQAKRIKHQKRFLSSVTHELRSPLASLCLATDTMKTRDLKPEVVRRMLDMMSGDVERLSRLVDRILISARLDEGISIVEEEFSRFNLRKCLISSIEGLNHLDVDLDSRLRVDCDPELEILGSPTAISAIFRNLIENAVKYSPKGKPIQVRAHKESRQWVLEVEDEGFGISTRDLTRVFRMFHRADTATEKAIPGTGLGLYIVKSIVESMGGTIEAKSAGFGKGALFTMTLPIV